jgi:hypothetical protein
MILYIYNVMPIADLCDVWFHNYMMDKMVVGHHY